MEKSINWFAIILIVSLIISIISIVLRKAFRLGIVILAIIIIGSIGFIWLPEKVNQVTSGQTTTSEVVNGVVNDYGNSGMPEAIHQGSQTAKTTAERIWDAIVDWYEGN